MRIADVVASDKGGEAYDRFSISEHNIHIILFFNIYNYHCHSLDNSTSYYFEQKQITNKKQHI